MKPFNFLFEEDELDDGMIFLDDTIFDVEFDEDDEYSEIPYADVSDEDEDLDEVIT